MDILESHRENIREQQIKINTTLKDVALYVNDL